ncbi:hypothetical protein EHI8A_040140 [Entamoeba histolytica HM-1:IMSS-B]|uniref:Uncharacterized protein n=8 Tax=Entamoeba TaxID=5758 RepID=B1N2N9_ENTH1|nr:hypothetical protein EHI_182840 [Entamoeba histolytica HM-1:IMSS]XP_008856509.1 hypothetical protein ENU1_066070 [Entamoeba nuttalli P19]EMD45069.1 Hypothetical protein EHI5A_001720 [Entamoeba histolytica KU27]EMH74327.1 hypothetical protein EHI8A_040140 [Entamoeba histolytica HM-1:IMSS-B]EMS10717.1 hypothetical protein KM1_002370 [Entamoeba histolytica HM-3:IMSS]ENY63911.1 hypothetical protein EHI7A_021510 [Entamoeba histolytica HM-1:IMSS-A]GAT92547.1 hypothetical protein CL6EHI_182840 [E|eukprot:XP_008856509.1 hypothetical protein ENU1_066070 [Entamoeba nuttalli P19]
MMASWEIAIQEIQGTMGERSQEYFQLLRSYLLCQISKSEYTEQLYGISQTFPTIIQLNNNLLSSLLCKNGIEQYPAQIIPPVSISPDDAAFTF